MGPKSPRPEFICSLNDTFITDYSCAPLGLSKSRNKMKDLPYLNFIDEDVQ